MEKNVGRSDRSKEESNKEMNKTNQKE